MNKIFKNLSVIVSIALLLQFGCKKEESTPSAPQNHAPEIQSLNSSPASSASNRIPSSTQVTLSVVATDQDKDNLSYSWYAARGNFVSGYTSATAIWQPPQSATDEDDTIFVTVNDGVAIAKSSITVYVAKAIPLPPILLSPADHSFVNSISPILSWNASSGAMSYELQVAINISFSSFVYKQNGLTSTSQQITGLSNYITYYWRVNATNGFGTSSWSSIWDFTTEVGGTTGTPCPGTPTVTYEEKTYHTVQIGSQCWLKENLNVDKGGKSCYNNLPSNCDTFGGLYRWDVAMQNSTAEGAQGICPNGWHIPTQAEFQTLKAEVNNNGNALKAIGQGIGAGAGTNTSGFSLLLAGLYSSIENSYSYIGAASWVWSSTTYDSYNADLLRFFDDMENIDLPAVGKNYRLSIRCLKD